MGVVKVNATSYLVWGLMIAALLGLGPAQALAESQASDSLGVDLTIQDVGHIITGIACWTLSVILAVMMIAVVIAGLRFFLSRGEPGAVTAARKNLLWVLAGIAVILAVYVIIATIAGFIGANYKSFLPLQCEGSGARFKTECDRSEDCSEGFECVRNPGDEKGICISR